MIIPSIFKSVGKSAVAMAAGAVGAVISAPLVAAAAIPSATIGVASLASAVGATLSTKEEKTYTTEEISKILGVSEYTVRKKIRFGKLKAKNIIGKKGYVITETDLQNYLNSDKKNNEEVVSLQAVPSSALDFDTKVELLTREILGHQETAKSEELIREFVVGKEIELEGLTLKLSRFDLEENHDSSDFKKRRTELLIEINELKSTIQAYKVVLARVQEDTKTKKG